MSTETLPSVVQTLTAQGAPPSQIERIRVLHTLCERSPGCCGLALVGSYAKNQGDRISDLDLVAFFRQGTAGIYLSEAHQLLASHDLVSSYSGRFKDGAFRKYVFLDFSSCELYALNLPTDFRLYRPYLPVWDPTGLLARLEVDGAPPRHEDFEAYPHGDDGLLWELFDCIKWLKRGRTELTKTYLRKLVNRLPVEGDKGAV